MLIESYSNKRGEFWNISKFQVNGWSKSIIIPAGIDSFGWFEFVNYLGYFFNRSPVFSSKNRGILPLPTKIITQAKSASLIHEEATSGVTSSSQGKAKELLSDLSEKSGKLWMNSLIVTRSDTNEDWLSIKNYLDMIGKTEISIQPFDNLKAIVFCKTQDVVNLFLTWEKPLIFIYTRLICSPWSETCNSVDGPIFCHNSWVIVEGLPFSLWSKSWFTRIGAKCGELLEIDQATSSFENLHYARVKFSGLKDKTIPSKLRIQRGDDFFNIRLRHEDVLKSQTYEDFCPKNSDALISSDIEMSSPSFKHFFHGSSSKIHSPGSVTSSPEILNGKLFGQSDYTGEEVLSSEAFITKPAVFSFFSNESIALPEEGDKLAADLNTSFHLNEEREVNTDLHAVINSDINGLQVSDLNGPIEPFQSGQSDGFSSEDVNLFLMEPDFLSSLVHFPYLTLKSTELDFDPFYSMENHIHGPYLLQPTSSFLSEAGPYTLFPEIISISATAFNLSSSIEDSSESLAPFPEILSKVNPDQEFTSFDSSDDSSDIHTISENSESLNFDSVEVFCPNSGTSPLLLLSPDLILDPDVILSHQQELLDNETTSAAVLEEKVSSNLPTVQNFQFCASKEKVRKLWGKVYFRKRFRLAKYLKRSSRLKLSTKFASYLQSDFGLQHEKIIRSMLSVNSLMNSSFQDFVKEGHQGCVNAVAWNSKGSLLISGSDDTRINIWSYSGRKLLHSVDTGHSANIFCTKFVPETSDELVVSGAGDAEVRLFNLSHLRGRGNDDNAIASSALYQCHTRRVKKLAVEIGNPNVVWSASEDGTLRQHDFREGTTCPPAGSSHQECHNVLLDLRCGAKRSLDDPPRQTLSLKSCDISSTRPHLLLVGGSDAFARLYDRRMLPPLTSSQKRMSAPPCVNYFCPMHLSDRVRSNLHLTHVTFSPNGEEILLSYSGEHVYLMNVNHDGGSTMQYTSRDVSKLMSFTPILNGSELQGPISTLSNDLPVNYHVGAKLEKCRKLLQIADKCLENGNYCGGIEACNEILDGSGRNMALFLKHDILCTRAALLLKRKWKNDVHIAIRDCYNARKINYSSYRAHYYMAEALSQLGRHKEALDFAFAAQCLSPSNSEVAEKVESVKRELAAAESEKSNKGNGGVPRSQPLGGVLSLSDFLYRSDANSDASQDGPRSEREDSDYDEEVELDFETLSGDEGHDVDPDVLRGSLNLRIHRRVHPARERVGANGFCGSPSSSSQVDGLLYLPEPVIDMKQRYVGHCNVGTDIKQASFLGQRGEYVASGSDDGRWFIWEKQTGRLIKILVGDGAVVNCVQSHPFDCAIATSGIDNTIKLWTPTAAVPSFVAGGAAGPEAADVLEAMENNQRRLCRSREPILPFEILERFRMHDFTEGSLHPFECAQS